MKLIIAGGRDYIMNRDDIKRLDDILDSFKIEEVVHGDAKGADTCGRLWAESRGVPVKAFPANWRPNGVLDRSAGMKRNRQMAQYVGMGGGCVLFPGGNGTAHMGKTAIAMGMMMFDYRWINDE